MDKQTKQANQPQSGITSSLNVHTPHYGNMPFEVPDNWVWCKLKDCCHIVGRIGFRGYTKDDLVPEKQGAITLSPSNIVENIMNYDKCTYISWAKFEESPEIKVIDGDILLVKTGSSFGKCALVSNLPQKATINPQFVVLKYIQIEKQYLTWVLQSGYARICYENFVLGTAIPTFTQAVLGDMLIPLPSINEQQRIIAEIKHWFALIDKIDQSQSDLQTIIKHTKSKFLDLAIHGKLVPQDPNDEPASELLKRINPEAEITCDNGHYPLGWCKTQLKYIADYVNGRAFKPEEWETNGLPIVRIQNLNDETAPYNKSSKSYEEKYLIHKGDLLFAWAASLGTYVWEKGDAWLNQHIFKVIPFVFMDKLYLYYSLESLIKDFYKESHGSGMVHITKKKFEDIECFVPPLAEQQRIVAKIEELFSILDSIQKSLEA